MKLEEIEKNLYQYQKTEEKEKTPSPPSAKHQAPEISLRTEWPEEKIIEKKQSLGSKFLIRFSRVSRRLFWTLMIGSLIIISVSGFYLYQYFTTRNITFSLKSHNSILIGVPFNIEANFQNNSDKPLKDVRLSMILPEGTALISESPDKRVFSYSLGDLAKDSSFQHIIPVIIFSNEQSVKRFDVTVSYLYPSLGPKARFEQTRSVEVTAKEPAIKLDLVAPQKVMNNENFEIEVHYQNISDINFSNARIELNYPQFFTFKEASLPPSVGNNIWNIDNLAKGATTETLIIKGSVVGAEGSFFEIKSSLQVEIFGQKYSINEKLASLNIASSPLSLAISVNGQPNYLAFTDSALKYKIAYRNNSDIGLNDVIIKARLIGEMFDIRTLRTHGFFSSLDNTVTWNAANTPDLRLLSPGADGEVEFEIKTKPTYPIRRLADKNFILKIEAEISSPTVPYYVASDKTIGLLDFETKVAGNVMIDSQALFYDPSSGFVNKGRLPPKVNSPTNFTIHWIIVNYSTDIRDVEVKAFLQSGVRWVNQVKSNVNTVPVYNERTQEITWAIDKIPATKGVISKPVEAIFQIEATPDITQINRPMPLLSETTLKAFDEFANIELMASDKELTTQLTDDPNFEPNKGAVVP